MKILHITSAIVMGILSSQALAQQAVSPVAQDDSYNVDRDVTAMISAPGVLENDSRVKGKEARDRLPLTALLVSDVTDGTLTLNADGSFSYTPTAGFVGTDGFSYQAYDGVETSNIANVALNVTDGAAANQPPVASDDAFATQVNEQLTVQNPGVLSNDNDPEGDPLTASLVSTAANGSLTFNADGSFVYSPDTDYVGSDSFTYVANDGTADSGPATVTITVSDIMVSETAPTANPDAYGVDEYSSLTVLSPGVLSNDDKSSVKGKAAKERKTLRALLVSDVANGILSLYDDGAFDYLPTAGFIGNDSFEYQVFDGVEYSNVTTVTITVNDVNFPPTISGTPDTMVLPGESFAFVPSSDDPDGDALTYTVGGLPAWMSFDAATGGISGIPSAADIGVYTGITITVSDGEYTNLLNLSAISVPAEVAQTFTIGWLPPTMNVDGTPLIDLQGHKLYYWDVNPYVSTAIVIDGPGLSSYVVEGFPTGLWMLAMVAYNIDGFESAKSEVLPVFIQ